MTEQIWKIGSDAEIRLRVVLEHVIELREEIAALKAEIRALREEMRKYGVTPIAPHSGLGRSGVE